MKTSHGEPTTYPGSLFQEIISFNNKLMHPSSCFDLLDFPNTGHFALFSISSICLFLFSLTAVTPLTMSLWDALMGLGFQGRIFV